MAKHEDVKRELLKLTMAKLPENGGAANTVPSDNEMELTIAFMFLAFYRVVLCSSSHIAVCVRTAVTRLFHSVRCGVSTTTTGGRGPEIDCSRY